jgi:aspartate aminotransferase
MEANNKREMEAMAGEKGINGRIAAIAPSVTLGITSRAKKMAAEGRPICNFGAGEPDFDTPDNIKASAREALEKGKTKYTPEAGLAELRAAIAEKLNKENGLAYQPEQIVISNGAKHSLFNIFMTICKEGDEVIIPGPWWLSYPEMVRMVGAKPVFLCASEASGFKVSPAQYEAAITRHTRAVVINSPSNPTGAVYSREELKAFAEISVEHGVTMISDEIYEKMVYDGTEHFSIGTSSPEALAHTITVNGYSKAFAMTGWRLGYLAAPMPVAKAIGAFQSHSTSAPNTFAQYAGITALREGEKETTRMVKAFAERRALMHEKLCAIPGMTCVKPMGAFYMFPNVGKFGLDSVAFAERLLGQEGVALIPGKPFGADANVRLSYACSSEEIRDGVAKLRNFCASL